MDCTLISVDGTPTCTTCGRTADVLHKRQMCGQKPCDPTPKHTCGQPLVRKQRLPQGTWWWRCEACHAWDRECKRCNAKQPSISDLASEHDAVD